MDKEHKDKIGLANSISLKGIHCSPKTEFKKGLTPWNKGKHFPEFQGENSSGWKGGISRSYAHKIFNESGKRWYCGCCKEIDTNQLLIHHVNGNQKDNKIENLSCVCNFCHNAMHDNPNKRATRFQEGHLLNVHGE